VHRRTSASFWSSTLSATEGLAQADRCGMQDGSGVVAGAAALATSAAD
jgi:hypothetical protein